MKTPFKQFGFCLLVVLLCVTHVKIARCQNSIGADFDPLGLLEQTQRKRESIAAGTYGYLFNLIPEQTLIDYADWNIDLARDTGITYLAYYASVGQFGSQGSPSNQTGNGNTHVLLAWKPTCQTGANQGGFIFYYMNVGQYGTSGVDFAKSLGISSFTSDSTSNVGLFRSIAWRQQFADGLIDFRIGQVEPASLFNAMPYANDNRAFLASPLSNEASRTLPASGVGMTLKAEVFEDIFLGTAIADANGKGEFLDFDSFFRGDYLSTVYVAVEPEIKGVGKGSYQVAMHFIDATDVNLYSRFLGINAVQGLGDEWDLFAKYNRADKRQSAVRQSAACGFAKKQVFGERESLLALGVAWADPSDRSLRDEYVMEAFWRSQLTPLVQLTPSLQFWFDPSMAPEEDFQAVFSVRLLGEF